MTSPNATRPVVNDTIREDAARLLTRTRVRRGLPRAVRDPATIEQLAAILRPGPEVRP